MAKIYTLIALSIFLFFVQCKGIQFIKKVPFKINNSVYHYWAGGVKDVKGINIQINGVLTKSDEIEFKQIYFKGYKTDLKTTIDAGNFVLNALINTSKRLEKTLTMHSDSIKEYGNEVPKIDEFPFELKDTEAVISFTKKGKLYYFKINLQKRNNQFYP